MAIISLNGSNYPTWKIQCRMALMKEGLWGIVSGRENAPPDGEAERRAKFGARRDRALAILVLSVEPTLLYLLGDSEDPVVVWKKLLDHFQKKTWANKLELNRRLYSLKLREGDSIQEHMKRMVEIFEELAVIGDPVQEEDQVIHLLAGLPESYSMLVTALEANADVPKMDVVMERLLHEERKQKDKESNAKQKDQDDDAVQPPALEDLYNCGKMGHIQWNCPLDEKPQYRRKDSRYKANTALYKSKGNHGSDSECDALMVSHAFKVSNCSMGSWIVDSGATSHMCGSKTPFVELCNLNQPMEVTLGDGNVLNVARQGVVSLKMKLSDGSVRRCKLLDVLYVPGLAYNLLSVSKAAESGNMTNFLMQMVVRYSTRTRGWLLKQSSVEASTISTVKRAPRLMSHNRNRRRWYGTGGMVIWGCKTYKG